MRRQIGRRGAFLLCLALYDISYGLYMALSYPIQHEPLIGETTWGWLWIGVGLFLATGIFTRHDAPWYATAILIKIIWALEYFRLNFVEHITGDWIRGCYWIALCGMVIVAAWWPEPTRIQAIPPPPHGDGTTAAETRARNV